MPPIAPPTTAIEMRPSALGRWLPLAIAAIAAVLGWQATRFLCDDAFIHFRYVANAYDGVGFVWNAPPFLPVEGYTSFLWAVILVVFWSATGIAPPDSANPLALACGLATLLLISKRLATMQLPAAATRWRPALACIVLTAIATNYTWITWQSSGLDAALFAFLAVGWTLSIAKCKGPMQPRQLAAASVWAALAQLARPDAALLALATIALAGRAWFSGSSASRPSSRRALVLALSPFLLPALHFVWRRATYGEWLPNTYYAKVAAAWPASGLRYLYCFALEHGVWPWLALAATWAAVQVRRVGIIRPLCGPGFSTGIAVATWGAFVGYYTLVVGGDHFAYRPFMLLVPMLFLATLSMGSAILRSGRALAAVLLVIAVSANSFGWWHEHAHRDEHARDFITTAAKVPAIVRPAFRLYDRYQAWMRIRHVGVKRGQLDLFCREMLAKSPPRGSAVPGAPVGTRGVIHVWAAGVISWTLPDVAVIDMLGLSDYVVARNPEPRVRPDVPQATRTMLFAANDTDQNGRLQSTELRKLAGAFDPNEMGVSMKAQSWAALWLASFDLDDDGLDAHEFANMVDLGFKQSRLMIHSRQAPKGYAEDLRANVRFDGERFHFVPEVLPLTDVEIIVTERKYRALMAATKK